MWPQLIDYLSLLFAVSQLFFVLVSGQVQSRWHQTLATQSTVSASSASPLAAAQQETDVILGVSTDNHSLFPVIDSPFVAQAIAHTTTMQHQKPPVAFVVPHHLVGSQLIAHAYASASQDIETIIIVGPNHFEAGEGWLLSSTGTWDTPYGQVSADTSVLNRLAEQIPIKFDDQSVAHEHSVSSQMSFIAQYHPKARVVPLVLSSHVTSNQLQSLISALHDLTDERTLLVASVDFSHFLTPQAAAQHDAVTAELLTEGKVEELLTLDSHYLDSPQSIATVFGVMELRNLTPSIIRNASSSQFIQESFEPTTTYFEVFWQ